MAMEAMTMAILVAPATIITVMDILINIPIVTGIADVVGQGLVPVITVTGIAAIAVQGLVPVIGDEKTGQGGRIIF
jgi:hypothetical protein